MRLLFLALLALAQDTYRPPVVPTPLPAEVVPSPYETQLQVPAVDVPSRVAMVTKINGPDVRGLAQAAAAPKALALQLAADPRWRVVDWDGGRVAYQRVADGKEWTVPLRGYHASAQEVWRAAIVLRPWAPTSVWATSPVVGRAPASSTTLSVSELKYVGNPDWRAAAWEWGDPGATLQVFEAGPRATVSALPRTSEVLGTLPNLMGRIAAEAATIEASGFSSNLLPGRAAKSGEPTVTLASPAPGELDVRAWLHVPGPGVTWARVLDGELLQPWEEAAVAAGTREVLGSSKDPKHLFYLQGRFPVPAGPAFSGTVEFWHQLDGAAAPARIAAFPVTIPAR
ncbi:MAG: hypothetical protein ACOZNI_01375 [Myxococcota bacterium]